MIRFGRYWLSVPASAEIHRTGAGGISMAKPPNFPNIVGCLIGFAAVGCGVGSLVGTAVEHHLKPKKGTFKIFRLLAPLTVRPHFQNQPRQLRHRHPHPEAQTINHTMACPFYSASCWPPVTATTTRASCNQKPHTHQPPITIPTKSADISNYSFAAINLF